MTEKKCTKCKKVKLTSDFNKDKSRKDGLARRCRTCAKAYYDANRERVSAEHKIYFQENKERIVAQHSLYKKEQPQRNFNIYSRGRCLKFGVEYIEDVDRHVVYGRDNMCCCGCTEFILFEEMHIDHVIPMSRGGEHSYKNVQALCKSCNHKKWIRTNEEMGWFPRGKVLTLSD